MFLRRDHVKHHMQIIWFKYAEMYPIQRYLLATHGQDMSTTLRPQYMS